MTPPQLFKMGKGVVCTQPAWKCHSRVSRPSRGLPWCSWLYLSVGALALQFPVTPYWCGPFPQVLPTSLQHHPQQDARSVCTVPVSSISCDVVSGTFTPRKGLGFALPSCFRLETTCCFFRCFLHTDYMQTVLHKSVTHDPLTCIQAVVEAPFVLSVHHSHRQTHVSFLLVSTFFLSFSCTYKYMVLEVIVYVIKICHIKCLFYTFPT